MQHIHFIHQNFQPVQPRAGGIQQQPLQYCAYKPALVLQPYIHSYWELKSTEKLLQEYPYPIVADGAVDLIFNCQHAEESLLSITNTRAFHISLNGSVHYFGIRFLPGCIHYFFEISLAGLTGQTIASGDCIGKELRTLEALIVEKADFSQRMAFVEQILLQRLYQRSYNADPRLLHSLHHILQSAGNAFIQKQVAEWISPRQMRRLFERYIGLNPKTFARIVRFQQTLAAMQQTPRKYWGRLCYDYGYFDQAHFIREFKLLYGDSPKALQFPPAGATPSSL